QGEFAYLARFDPKKESNAAGLSDLVTTCLDIAGAEAAGIGVLVKFYKELTEIQGSFLVSSASPPLKKVLEMANLGRLLIAEAPPAQQTIAPVKMVGHLDRDKPTFEVRDLAPGTKLACRAVGDPDLLRGCRFGEQHCRKMAFPDPTFAVGLGAFGHSFEDSVNRFGEFLAAAGAAAYQPTDGTNVPDYLVSAGTFVPELLVLYSIVCQGEFAYLARFDPKKESNAAGLSDLVTTCLDIAGAEAAGIIMVAESAGLMGAALRRSPAERASEGAPFEHPGIREWLSFSSERAYARALTLVAGVAARGDCGALGPMLRPLAKGSPLMGHFHAAAFSYRPLKKGRIDLQPTVTTLFQAETLQGVLHLLGDDREIAGAGQSEFLRGACWIGPIGEITT
ncbi:MAG: STAS domain-containing protein, partial [Acidobacteria bacterium]|nr:STAS domain-containing protein [Acidobacteriota bacterium]